MQDKRGKQPCAFRHYPGNGPSIRASCALPVIASALLIGTGADLAGMAIFLAAVLFTAVAALLVARHVVGLGLLLLVLLYGFLLLGHGNAPDQRKVRRAR